MKDCQEDIMRPLFKSLGVVSISMMMATSTLVPAQALMIERPVAPVSTNASELPIQVRDHHHRHRGYYRDGRGRHYYNGHRGYRDYRRGYRRHNNAWFPAAAFITGAIVGGAISSQPAPRARSGSRHVQWCYDRYRSYRASDNTYQPYNGPRRSCNSPYR